jgi:hypothetical protein
MGSIPIAGSSNNLQTFPRSYRSEKGLALPAKAKHLKI